MDDGAKVRAAADRLMELAAMPIDKQKPYVRLWPELGGDGIQVARAWLAANPADDGERISGEWLAGIGGKYQELGGAYSFFGTRKDTDFPLLWIDVHPDRDGFTAVSLVHEGKSMAHYLNCPTRGQVRRLLAALGLA